MEILNIPWAVIILGVVGSVIADFLNGKGHNLTRSQKQVTVLSIMIIGAIVIGLFLRYAPVEVIELATWSLATGVAFYEYIWKNFFKSSDRY